MGRIFWVFLCSTILWAGGDKVQIAGPAIDYALFPTVPINLVAISYDISQTYTYRWELSTGETYEGSVVLHPVAFDQTEPVIITMIATAADGTVCEPDTRIFYPIDITTFIEQPFIPKLTVSQEAVRPGEMVEVRATIVDPVPNSSYEYNWFWIENGRAKRATGEVLRTSFPDPGDEPEVYTISCIAKDGDGLYTFNSFQKHTINILVTNQDNLPPSVEIVQPRSGLQIFQGDTLDFKGLATDPEGETDLNYEWTVLNKSTSEIDSLVGPEVSFTFENDDEYQVILKASDSLEQFSPSGDTVNIDVLNEAELSTSAPSIITPLLDTRYFENDPIILIGSITGSTGSQNRVEWEFRNVQTNELVKSVSGLTPGRVTLPEQGLYELFMKGIVGSRATPRLPRNTRFISIHARDDNQEPLVLPSEGNNQYVRNGQSITLEADVNDPDGDPVEVLWALNGVLTEQTGTTATFSFNLDDSAFDKGITFAQSVKIYGIDAKGKPTTLPTGYSVFVYQDELLPEPLINELDPLETVYLPLGSPYPLSASFAEPYDGELKYAWTVNPPNPLNTVNFEGANPDPYMPLEAGLHYIQLAIETEDGSLRRAPSTLIYLYVFDASKAPESNITKPSAERIVSEINKTITLEGQFSDPNIARFSSGFLLVDTIAHQFNWEISGPNGFFETYIREEPLNIAFEQPGTYDVSFYVSNSLGLLDLTPDMLTIEVTEPRQDSDFEPNDTRDIAAEVDFGNFGGLSVSADDPVDWYQFCLEEAGSSVNFDFDLSDATGNVALQLFLGENLVEEVELQAGGPAKYSFIGAKAGVYYLRFAPSEASAKKRTGLDFSIGIEVATPRLIFPYPKSDEAEDTELLLLNPSNGSADITLVARSFDGGELGKFPITLGPGEQWTGQVSEVFTNFSLLDLGWVQVLANRSITGLSTTIGRDKATALAEPAIASTLEELVVPHIAQQTEQWYTRAAIINNSGEQVETSLEAAAGNFEVGQVANVFQSAVIDFEAFFGGTLPQGSDWASIVESNAKTNLAGMELFGTKLGSPRVAGLNLANARLKNPGFTYVRRNLYFPHVAGSDFWTGIAFVNIADTPTNLRLIGYDSQGEVLATADMTMPGFAKEVRLAHQFFENLAVDAGLSWIALETDGFIHGYELFGDNDSDATILSGFPAVTGGSTELIFRKIQAEEGQTFTGIAVVNLAETSEANLVYEAVAADGRVLSSNLRTIGSLRKDVALVQQLFNGGLPQGTAWVRVSSDQPIAGFQLYGDLAGNHMAGVLAQ